MKINSCRESQECFTNFKNKLLQIKSYMKHVERTFNFKNITQKKSWKNKVQNWCLKTPKNQNRNKWRKANEERTILVSTRARCTALYKKKGEGSRGNINFAQQHNLHSQQTNVPSLMHPATVDIDGSKQNWLTKKRIW